MTYGFRIVSSVKTNGMCCGSPYTFYEYLESGWYCTIVTESSMGAWLRQPYHETLIKYFNANLFMKLDQPITFIF